MTPETFLRTIIPCIIVFTAIRLFGWAYEQWKVRQSRNALTNVTENSVDLDCAPGHLVAYWEPGELRVEGRNRHISGSAWARGPVFTGSEVKSPDDVKTAVRGLKSADTTPNDQAALFKAILAKGPVTSAEVKDMLDCLDAMARAEDAKGMPHRFTVLRKAASILDRVAVERVDLALKLDDATRWERNPRRRPTLDHVKRFGDALRAPGVSCPPPIREVVANLLDEMAAELTASDRERHELSQAAIAARSYDDERRDRAAGLLAGHIPPDGAGQLVDDIADALGMVRS